MKDLAELFDMNFEKVNDLFYADKFAVEAYKNHCSANVFIAAEDNVKYMRSTNAKQSKISFDQ